MPPSPVATGPKAMCVFITLPNLVFLPSRFFLADRNVYGLAIAMTLLASFISPVTLLGTPAEIYTYGGQYMAFILMQFLLFPTIALVFVPVFHGLDITTAYEVNKSVREMRRG